MTPGIEEKRLVNGVLQNGWPSYATLHQASVSIQDMGDRVITTQVRIDGDVVPDFSGWELYFKGERFVLPSDNPQAMKDNSSRDSIVDLQFQSWPIQELKRYYFFEAASVSAGVSIADKYVAPVRLNVEDFMVMLNKVLKYYFGNKIVADLYMSGQGIYSQEPKIIEINYSYLWDVVCQVFEIYGVRNRIEYNSTTGVYTIKFGYPAPAISDHDFEYGYQGGLLKFERQVQDETITNILLGRGGEKNLPYRYFKLKEENAGTTWEGDPDAIPELANIYFDRLRDANFRWYVRGWMHNPNRDTSGDEAWDPGHVFPTYEISQDSPYYWAYQKGLTDEQFSPVEYVKDDASIEAYGERWGAADDNDEIYPTIQGRSRSPIGRIDEVVAVSEIITDDIAASAAEAIIEKSINPMLVTRPGSNPYEILTDWFEIPTGQTGNISSAWVGPTEGDSVTHIETTQSTLVALDSNGTVHPISGLSAGQYRLRLTLKLYVPDGHTTAGTWGLENIKLTTSAQDANAWKPTFDIWVKNIWNTTKGSGESDEQYAARVWEKILGDRVGNEAKVVFSTGFMSVSEDYEFVIASYPVYDTSKNINGVQSEWKITLRKSDAEYDATGLFIPNASTGGKPIAGDKFFFTGIDMPFLYVTLGEEDLNTNKSSRLDGLSVVNPTWVISLDKVRVHTLEDGEYGQTLAERLAAGAKLNITDPRFSGGDVLTLYAQSITYTWNEPSENSPYIVPDIEVVLSDKVVSRQSRTDKMESSIEEIKSNYARLDDVERVVRSVSEPLFLKKTGEADSSDSPTQFSSKVSSKGFRQGGVGGAGWGFYRDNTQKVAEGDEGEGDSVLEVDRVVVRKELEVNSLVVNQTEYRGGREIQSAAEIECTKVVVDESTGKYVCYFDQKQGSVKNLFVVGDFAYSTEFAPDNTVVKYYRRRVDAVDVDRIVLSDTVKDGAGVPAAGDVIIQYGHESNAARQFVIVRDVIGGGYERMISGLSTVSAAGEEYYFAGRQVGQYYDKARWFVGSASGEYAEYLNGQLNIKGRLTVMNNQGAYVSMQDYMNAVSLQFDEQQREIDKQTQSWASGEAPTAQTKPYPLWDEETQQIIGTPNFPYTQWLDDTERAKHVGDSYVDDSAGQSYRLTKKTVSGTTVYYWTRITDEEISQAISTSQQAYAAAEALQYLKSATNEGTLVDGGLVLTSMIQLGYTPQGGSYTVMSGINGKPNTQLQDPTRSIAAWFGGPMVDHETYPSVQSYAKSLFRMDGSGYLAGGNIHWDENGYGGIPGITWSRPSGSQNDVITIGSNVILEAGQGADQSVASMVSAVNSLQQILDWFEEVNLGTDQNPAWAVRLKKKTVGSSQLNRAFMTYGDQIVVDGTPGGGGGGGSQYLHELLDVTIANPSNGQALVYRDGVWVNENITTDLTNYYTKSEVDALIGAIEQFHYEIYPSTSAVTNPQSNVLYLIGPTGSGSDKYEEYVYANGAWTKIGDTSIDLSGYVQTARLEADEAILAEAVQSLQSQIDAVSARNNYDELTATSFYADMMAVTYAYAERYYLTDDVYFSIEKVNGTACVRLNAPFITDGDQIIISGTPGSGGGGSGVTLYDYTQVKAMTADVALTAPSAWAMHQMWAEIFGGASSVLTSGNYTNYVNTTNFPGLDKLGTVTSVATGTGLTGGPITSAGVISIDPTYLGYISHGETAYGWGDILTQAIQSFQSQIDSVSARDAFDELTATALYADTGAISALYAGSIELGGEDLATAVSGIRGRLASVENKFDADGSALSAVRLKTARTLWGQNFDGTANVVGNMTSVGSIDASGLIKTTNYAQAQRFYLTDSIYFYTETIDGVACVMLNAPFVTSGDQIIISGTPGGGGQGVGYLYELEDVSDALASPTSGMVLFYNGTEWVGVAASSIGGVTSVVGQTGAITTEQVANALTAAGYKLTDTITTSLAWSAITNKPTTLAGYGITDAASASALAALTTRVGTLESDEAIVSAAIQSLQSQIDSVSARDQYDELTATALYVDTLSASNAYIGSITGSLSGNAATASRLVGASYNVGNVNKPVYFSGGLPVETTYAIYASLFNGTAGRLAYYNTAHLVSDYTGNVGSGVIPMYLNAGVPTASTSTVGSAALPVYLNGGTITACSGASIFSQIGSNTVNNLELTIAGQLRTATLYATYDNAGENISDKFGIVGQAIQSLQSQVDSVSARNSFDELDATVGFIDTLSVGDAVYSKKGCIAQYLTVGQTSIATYPLYVVGVIASTGDQVVTSDATKKKNLKDIALSVRQIASAPAVTFDWKAGGHSFGSIAQYWRDVLPESVLGDEGDYSLAYAQLALVSAINLARHETEQDREIRELKEKVARLENKVERLRN